jgi:hypothetical protein
MIEADALKKGENKMTRRNTVGSLVLLIVLIGLNQLSAIGQTNSTYVVFGDEELEKIVPSSFYFAGQSAPTQMRNSAAGRVGRDRFVIAGLVDTSGYSAEISGKYSGFFITDSPITVGNRALNSGSYGFGFAQNGTLRIFELNAKQLLSVAAPADRQMNRPKPLQMVAVRNGIRLYHGRNFVLLARR